MFRIFFTGDADACLAEEIAELHVLECEEDADWVAEDLETGEQTPLCLGHKEALKDGGLTEPPLEAV